MRQAGLPLEPKYLNQNPGFQRQDVFRGWSSDYSLAYTSILTILTLLLVPSPSVALEFQRLPPTRLRSLAKGTAYLPDVLSPPRDDEVAQYK